MKSEFQQARIPKAIRVPKAGTVLGFVCHIFLLSVKLSVNAESGYEQQAGSTSKQALKLNDRMVKSKQLHRSSRPDSDLRLILYLLRV